MEKFTSETRYEAASRLPRRSYPMHGETGSGRVDLGGVGRWMDVVEKREQQHVEKEIQLNFLVCLNAAASSCRLNWHEVTPITDPKKRTRRGMAGASEMFDS